MSICLVLPPLTQLNTPYPSISYLARHLRSQGIECEQRDLGIELCLALFSRAGLTQIFDHLADAEALPEEAWRALSLREHHQAAIDPLIAYLQGRDASLATSIASGRLMPSGPRQARAQLEGFGPLGKSDQARYLATLYLAELADLIASTIDSGFALSRYQAQLATSAHDFSPLWQRLSEETLVDQMLDQLTDSIHSQTVALSVPFPGNLYAALRIGLRLKTRGAYVVLGGGYVNTELRQVQEERLWQCVDAICYDDGEGPLQALLEHRLGGPDNRHRTRTAGQRHDAEIKRPPLGFGADYQGLALGQYLDTLDTLNPAHRLWNEGRWNKITLAHGCYWKRCTFCDVHLDYIAHYEAADVQALVDHVEAQVHATGQRGFHFVDEAAPPKLLRSFALELLRRGLKISFWGNIRFEKSYDPDLCRLLSAAGLVAVTAGLEVANERLLQRIDKGITVEQVARTANAFQDAGVMVHAYLMYGFPTQTLEETVDSMELVRQLFAQGLLQSGFWHRFVLTRHAPIYAEPARFGVELASLRGRAAFADNDVPHRDPSGADHDLFDTVLPTALASWLEGKDLDRPVHTWFEGAEVAPSREDANRIADALVPPPTRSRARLLWIGGEPLETEGALLLHTPEAEVEIPGTEEELGWLLQLLQMTAPGQEALALGDAIAGFPGVWDHFEPRFQLLREVGLLLLSGE